jgi:hypothetical protein
MLVNFLVMCLSVLALPRHNPELASRVTVLPRRSVRTPLAAAGAALLTLFLGVHVWKDLTAEVAAWYFHSTVLWILVMAAGSAIYLAKVAGLRRRGVDVDALFSTLPPE